jgi:hypothetical protein
MMVMVIESSPVYSSDGQRDAIAGVGASTPGARQGAVTPANQFCDR